mgnify:CR=1 FL=1
MSYKGFQPRVLTQAHADVASATSLDDGVTQSKAIDEFINTQIKRGVPNGAWNTRVDEDCPGYQKAGAERVYQNDNDAWIVLGRDRTGNMTTGAGGAGLTKSGCIDLCAGRFAGVQAARALNGKPLITKKEKVNPNFASDAARVYITQKTLNIDEAFGFTKKNGSSSEYKSAIGIKADHTRIIGRESVRVYAGQGRFEGLGQHGETCSNGDTIAKGNGKIELIGGNADENSLQPVVLGENLKNHLTDQSEVISQLHESIMKINQQLATINGFLMGLPFVGAAFSRSVGNNIEEMLGSVQKSLQQKIKQVNALEGALVPGEESILSNDVFIT